MERLRVLSLVAATAGGITLFGGAGHTVAVTAQAIKAGQGYDQRLGTMLAIGYTVLCVAALLLASARLLWKGDPRGMVVAMGASGFMVAYVALVVLAAGPVGLLVHGAVVAVMARGWRSRQGRSTAKAAQPPA